MISIRRKVNKLATTICLLAVCSSLLIACGESTDGSGTVAGIGGTGIVAGKITGFGSIHVNGGRYNINTSTFVVDGQPFVGLAGQEQLSVGMVVQLRVGTENGVFTNTALEVVYDDEIEGPTANIALPDPTTKTGTIFGQAVTFDATSTVFVAAPAKPDFDFGSLGNDQVVEVSGFRVSPTEITATYVRFVGFKILGSSEVELRGPVKILAGVPPNQTFTIDGVSITTDPGTVLEVPGDALVEDLYVEIKGIIQVDSSVAATKVEFEDEDFDDDVDEINLQGVVAGFAVGGITNFFIDSQQVNAGNAQPAGLTLMDGMNIEVEGKIVGGILIADEVEVREGETKLRSEISMVDTINNEFFKVIYPVAIPNEITVRIDGQTLFEDETGAALVTSPFSLDDLAPMDFVRIEGQEILNNEVLATVVKRTDPDTTLELEGEVDEDFLGSYIKILGIEYPVDSFTTYDPDNVISQGDSVEIEDGTFYNPYGIADEVEVE